MTRPVAIDDLRLALEVIAYELECRPDDYRCTDPIDALDRLRAATDVPATGSLKTTYPAVVELATRALVALASLPEPSEVDGLTQLGGFEVWRAQR